MNAYIPVSAKVISIVKHTDIEWTFRVETSTDNVLPGKFYEISIPKHGESPISVSGYGENYIDFTIRNVGKVTSELFNYKVGDKFFIRGPYGNGFDVSLISIALAFIGFVLLSGAMYRRREANADDKL